MRIIDLALKDLVQIARDRRTLLFLIFMPILFTLFMGFAYQSGSNGAVQDERERLGWVNLDTGGDLSQALHELLASNDALELVEMSAPEVDDPKARASVAGVLVVPAGFSLQAKSGMNPQITLLADINSIEGQVLHQALRGSITRLMSAVEIARISEQAAGSADEFLPAFRAASEAWRSVDTARRVQVEVVLAAPEQPWYGSSPYNQASPGVLVQFAIFGLVTSGQIVVQERKMRTLKRMMTTSMRSWQILAGHTLAIFAIVFLQEALLVVFGQVILGVNYAREPLATLVVSLGLGLWIAAAGLLVGVFARNDSQVVLFSLIGMFIFSALGGTWFPLESSGSTFAAVSKLMPSTWAMTGFQNILIRGQGLEAAWTPTLILCGYAVVFFLLAVTQFKKVRSDQ